MSALFDLWNNSTWIQLIANIFVVFCCFPIHEFCHAWMASRLGDYTAAQEGRITLNPLKHLDFWGALIYFIFGMGYAKPVPVTKNNFPNPRKDSAIVFLAGPMSNLIMAVLLLLIENIVFLNAGPLRDGTYIAYIIQCLRYASLINFQLTVLNLIPIPPFDGYHVIKALINNRFYDDLEEIFMRHSLYVMLGLVSLFVLYGISLISDVSQDMFYSVDTVYHQIFF